MGTRASRCIVKLVLHLAVVFTVNPDERVDAGPAHPLELTKAFLEAAQEPGAAAHHPAGTGRFLAANGLTSTA